MTRQGAASATLYARLLRKYNRLKGRAEQGISEGTFYRYTLRKRISIIHRLRRMFRRLQQLETQLKLGTVGAALALMLNTGNADAQTTIGPFIENYNKNPLHPPITGKIWDHPFLADLDCDGLKDMITGTYYGRLFLYKNIGTAVSPRYLEVVNPFSSINFGFGSRITPFLFDADGDGDLDLLVSVDTYYAGPALHYFENDGDQFTPSFDVDDTGKYADVYRGGYNAAVLADLDNDGDLDIVLGGDATDGSWKALEYFEYDEVNGTYVWQQDTDDPFNQFNSDTYYHQLVPTIVDVDGDNKLDVVFGAQSNTSGQTDGKLHYLHNEGTINAPVFILKDGPLNPFDAIDVKRSAAPAFADIDGDGDMDLVVGQSQNSYGEFTFARNDGGAFTLLEDFDSPFGGAINNQSGRFNLKTSAPTFVDLDNDGDMDAVIGGKYGPDIKVYENTGTAFGNYANSPFTNFLGYYARWMHAAFFDQDGDGDMDMALSYQYYSEYYSGSSIKYFENKNGDFIEATPIITASDPSPRFAPSTGDFDGDGDADIISGYANSPQLIYLENDGDGNFSEPTTNPFNIPLSKYGNLVPVFVDIDHDGDLDAFAGSYRYILALDNDGGTMTEMIGANNPLSFVSIRYASPAFADIDQDGDLDAFVGGGYDGTIHFFENVNEAPYTVASNSNIVYTENDPAMLLDSNITIVDVDNDPSAFKAVIAITNNFAGAEDQLQFTPLGNITGSYDAVTGTLTLSGYDDMVNYETALGSVTYINSSKNPSTASREVTFYVFDLDATDPMLDSTPDGVVTINVNAINDAPILSVTGGITFTENDPATPFATSVTISDVDNTTLSVATITISSNLTASEDQLVFSSQNGISGSYDSSSGILTLAGSATLAQYQTALQSVTYLNISEDPSSATRTISIQVDDGTDLSNIATADIAVVPVEEPPILNVAVYNAFSPDPDNLNPYFRIDNIENFPGNSVSIYNRWGDPVFNVSDYQNDDPGRRFEGFNKNGSALSSGAYFYEIQIPGLKTLMGYLIIKR